MRIRGKACGNVTTEAGYAQTWFGFEHSMTFPWSLIKLGQEYYGRVSNYETVAIHFMASVLKETNFSEIFPKNV